MEMQRINRVLALALILLIIFLLPGCQQSPEGAIDENGAQETIIVEDCLGRKVEVPKNVERIAALYSFAGYAVGLLGRGADLVAVPGGLKRDVLFCRFYPEVKEASVPRQQTINIEELLKIKPDLVIIREDTASDEKEVEKLEKAGLPYIVVEYSTIEEQQKALEIIGKAIGREKEAAAYNEYYNQVIARVQEVLQDIPEDERVRVYHSENQALRTIHHTSLAADWSRAAGIINVSVGEELTLIGNDYYTTLEQVLIWDPEVIIANENTAVDLILGNPQWSGIKAVREGRVYQLPHGISRWGHPSSVETPLVILWTAKTVYPELFEDVDMEAEVEYFYKTFFNYQLSEEDIKQILSGKGLREPKGESS
jgi:iron complex transport system substrate-binding protein